MSESDLLRNSAAFAGLSDEQMTRLGALGEQVAFADGQVVFEEDSAGAICYLLLEGRVDIEVRSPFEGRAPQRLGTIRAGELFGELALVDGHLRSATARAAEPCRALAFDNGRVQALLEQEPAIGYRVMRNVSHQLAQRLRSTNMKLRNALMDVLYY